MYVLHASACGKRARGGNGSGLTQALLRRIAS
jgi:hypothetical protein